MVIDLNEPPRVFCYGTLLPGQERWIHLEPYVIDQFADRVGGRLYDTGLGYPAARFDEVGNIVGRTFELDRSAADEALDLLDEIEGAVEGLYHRVSLVTMTGARAFAYQYGGPPEVLRAIRSGSWLDR